MTPTDTNPANTVSSQANQSAPEISRLKRLYELSMQLSGDPMDIFVHVARMIGELLDVKVVCLSEIQGQDLHFLSVYVQGEVFTHAGSCSLSITPCATVEASKELRVIHNVTAKFPKASFLNDHNAFSYCGFPALDNHGQVVAVTCLLDDKPHIFTEEDQALLRIVGQRIGMEIERKRLDMHKEITLSALRSSEQQNRLILDNAGDGIIILNESGHIEGFNRAAQLFFGYTDFEVLGKVVKSLFNDPEEMVNDHGFALLLKRAQKEGSIQPTEIVAYRKNRSSFPAEISIGSAQMVDRRMFTLIVRDISLRKLLEQKLSLTQSVFENTSEGIVITDAQNRIVAVNKALCEVTGYSEDELIGKTPAIWKSGHHLEPFYQALWTSLIETGHWQGEIWNRRKNGESMPLLENINVVYNEDNSVSGYVAIMTDITSIKQFEERLLYLAHHDALTGLANRVLLNERIGYAMRQTKRNKRLFALCFIDLDRFKNINDSFGHSVGDQILQIIAKRITAAVRKTDTVARLGGDEFVVLLSDLDSADLAVTVATKLLLILSEPILILEREFIVTSSIGIALFPRDAQNTEDLLKYADTAMYHAKDQGRNNYQFYSPHLGSKVYENLMIENALRTAQDREELTLHYQPQFDLVTGGLIGAEALIRWQHPELGMISPTQFIPLAEESRQIIKMGEWVLETACWQVKQWLNEGIQFGKISVNVSALQIQQSNFSETVAKVLSKTGLPSHHLELEVTESFIIEAEQSLPTLEELRKMGVELAIDDFGTSYSSLKYLKLLPIQYLKIDQSFVKDIPDSANGNAIAQAVIALAKSLQLKVVAEGIENKSQHDFLFAEGCDYGQGYYFGKPTTASDFEKRYLASDYRAQ